MKPHHGKEEFEITKVAVGILLEDSTSWRIVPYQCALLLSVPCGFFPRALRATRLSLMAANRSVFHREPGTSFEKTSGVYAPL